MKFDKYKRLKECVDYLDSVEIDRGELKHHSSNISWLIENITISDITPRQTGTSTSIAELFDVEQDLYVSFNVPMINEFEKILHNIGKTKTIRNCIKYAYIRSIPSQEEKLLHTMAEHLHITLDKNLTMEIPNALRGKRIERIAWFDVGQYGMYEYKNVVYTLIKKLHAIYPSIKFIIC